MAESSLAAARARLTVAAAGAGAGCPMWEVRGTRGLGTGHTAGGRPGPTVGKRVDPVLTLS